MAWFRRKKEQRAIESVPWDTGDGVPRSRMTEQRALALAPVYAANRHIADTVSTLPLDAYRNLGDVRQPMSSLPQLFRDMQTTGQLGPWLYQAVTSLGLRGNAVGYITARDGLGFPTAITWLAMCDVTVNDRNPAVPVWYWRGRQLDPTELVHIPWFCVPYRTLGLSPIEAFALTVGHDAQQYGADWFRNGGFPPGTFKNNAQTVDAAAADIIRSRLTSSIRKREPLVYGNDWDYNAITVPPEQAQFIETLKLSATQIATIYGIAPEEIGGESPNSMNYTNEEARLRRRMSDLRPWLVRLEQAFSAILPERQYVKFNADATVRADLLTRWQVHKIRREIGAANIDEIRALEDEPPLPDGAGTSYAPLSTSSPAVAARSNGHSSSPPAMKEFHHVES